MSFSADQIAEYGALIEKLFWSRRRPPLQLREKLREGQRIEGSMIDLFFMRPRYDLPTEWLEDPIARLRHFPRLGVWRIYWMRADMKWHAYKTEPERRHQPEIFALEQCLQIVDEDRYHCFFG